MEPPSSQSLVNLFPETFKPITVRLDNGTSFFALHSQTSSPTKKVLVLLHGYPQNHTLYHRFAHELLKLGMLGSWDVVIPDLPGYGKSTKTPSADGSHFANSKRAIAADLVFLINELYSETQRFVVVGHDRGARVAYRLAADYPGRVLAVSLLEILPSQTVFASMISWGNIEEVFNKYHWIFLALPSPVPETLISASSDFYYRYGLGSLTGSSFKTADGQGGTHLKYDSRALASWITQYRDPAVILGALEDYRAGASIDMEHDSEPNSSVKCPMLVACGKNFHKASDVAGVWKSEKIDVEKLTVKQVGDEGTGHFIPYEAAEDCAREVYEWLAALQCF
ncbi:putative epoxide hydrolase [Mycena floridula]|nr:putative epoxide hydrolase [Mycena floridula]